MAEKQTEKNTHAGVVICLWLGATVTPSCLAAEMNSKIILVLTFQGCGGKGAVKRMLLLWDVEICSPPIASI